MTAVRLYSPHSPVALAERLKVAVGESMSPSSAARVTGYSTEARMTLWSHRPDLRNSFKAVLSARIEPEGSGSAIIGTLGAHAVARMFMLFWMGLVVVFGLGGLAVVLFGGVPLAIGFPLVVVPGAMFALAAALLWIGRRTAREDEARILAFLAETVAAREV